MEKLKVGMSFEVVEVLYSRFTDKTLFKIGGFTIGENVGYKNIKCMGNGSMEVLNYDMSETFMGTCYLNMSIGYEVKPIGRLTITSIK